MVRTSARAVATGALTALLVAPPAEGRVQPIRFHRLSLDQGLSQTTVQSILQDRQGFMWFATEDGLNRYDGVAVRVYNRDPADPASLPANVVWAIAEDAAGDLWVGTEGGGVARWDRRRDRFVRMPARPGGLASDNVRALTITKDGLVVIGTRDSGVDILDPRSGAVRHFRRSDPGGLSHDGVYALLEDVSGVLWVATDGGLNQLDPRTGEVRRFVHDPGEPRSLPDDHVRALLCDRAGALWVATQGGGLAVLKKDGVFERHVHDPEQGGSLSGNVVRALLQDSSGRLWVGTRSGLNLRRADGGFTAYRNQAADPASLGDDDVMSLYQDRTGIVWVGTRSAGVHRFNPRNWSFGAHGADADDPQALPSSYVTSFSVGQDGRLWVGTLGGGLTVLDRAAGRVTRYRHDPSDARSLSDDGVMALRHGRDGILWIGTMEGGLNRFDPATGRFTAFRHDPARGDSLSSNAVMSLLEDRRGDLWVGTFGGGLNALDRGTGTFRRYRHEAEDTTSLSNDIVTCLTEDGSGSGALWVGTDGGGLNHFRPSSGRFTRVSADAANPQGLANRTIFALRLDAEGRLWVGTRGGGLSALETFDEASGRAAFRTWTEREGLPNAVVYGIEPDDAGRLWLSTNRGLAAFDRASHEVQTFTVAHGLQSNEFNFGAHHRSPAGELLFGGPAGFNAFVPAKLELAPRGPALALTGLLKGNSPVKEGVPVPLISEIELGYRERVLTFEFAALDFAAPELNRYAYRLDGFDAGWVDAGSLRHVTYTNLDPGAYVFRARARNADGLWSREELSVAVRALPPPWRTWWAYAGYALVLACAALALQRRQARQAERDRRYRLQLEAEVEARTRDLAEQKRELETLNARLLETSLTDSLTGLRNRRYFFDEMSRELSLVERARQDAPSSAPPRCLIFIMVDLDRFKPINDTCGHAAGDRVLRQVCEVLKQACRESDVIVRWGGDEFLVVARQAGLDQPDAVPERIRSMVERTAVDLGEGQNARLSCSIGFTCYPWRNAHSEVRLSLEQVVALADSALYVAKKNGRNGWVGLVGTGRTTLEDVVRASQGDHEGLAQAASLEIHASRRSPSSPGLGPVRSQEPPEGLPER